MLNQNRILALGAASTLSLFTLLGCAPKAPETAAPSSAAEAPAMTSEPKTDAMAEPKTDAMAEPKTDAMAGDAGLGDMSMQITEAKTAVTAGNFDAAKTAVEKVEDAWKTVEDGVKEKDKAAYDAIETHLDEATNLLKGASPDAAAVTEHLDMLETAVTSIPK